MPSANDALSGETKTFESRCAALIVFQSANENAFDALSTPCSADVSGARQRGDAPAAPASARRIDARCREQRGERDERRRPTLSKPTRDFDIAHSSFE